MPAGIFFIRKYCLSIDGGGDLLRRNRRGGIRFVAVGLGNIKILLDGIIPIAPHKLRNPHSSLIHAAAIPAPVLKG